MSRFVIAVKPIMPYSSWNMVLEGTPKKSASSIKPAEIPGIVLECAFNAVAQGFIVLVLGGIAVSILGGLLHDKIPSAPPGLGGSINPGAVTAAAWHSVSGVAKANRLWIISAIFFAQAMWIRFYPQSDKKSSSRAAKRLSHAFSELSSNWFSLLIGNAFVASVTAVLVVFAGNFSVTKILLHTFLGGFVDWLTRLGGAVIGTGPMHMIHGQWSWFLANQFKFTFWLLFLGAMLDDLGLPNFKTLGRWLWRRLRRSVRPEPPRPPATPAQDLPSATPSAQHRNSGLGL